MYMSCTLSSMLAAAGVSSTNTQRVYCLVTSLTAFIIPTDQSSNDLTAAWPPASWHTGRAASCWGLYIYTEESQYTLISKLNEIIEQFSPDLTNENS